MNQQNNFNPVIGQPMNNTNQTSQNFNSYDPTTGQPMNNINQPNQNFNSYNPTTGQSINNTNQLNQNNNTVEQQNNLNNQSNHVNDEVDKAFNTLKKDFVFLAVLHFMATIIMIFISEINLITFGLRFLVLGLFVIGIICANNKNKSCITFGIINAIFLILSGGIIEFGLAIFLLIHCSKCSKVIKNK